MAHIITLKIETVDAERRSDLMEAICEMLSEHLRGADEAELKFTREGKTVLGKRKTVDTIVVTEHDPISWGDIEEGLNLSVPVPMDSLWTPAPARSA